MTLIVARKEKDCVWIIGDTAITGGRIDVRKEEIGIKIERCHDFGVVAYSGDRFNGERIMRNARGFQNHPEILNFLKEESRRVSGVDLAYACFFKGEFFLYKISLGLCLDVDVLFLGDNKVFSKFQEIFHEKYIDHAPDAIHKVVSYSMLPGGFPEDINRAIISFTATLYSSHNISVGGLVVPYILNEGGVQVCGYTFSVTEPITKELAFGDAIPFGSAQGGAFSFSLSELSTKNGFVVYWLQNSYGKIFREAENGYSVEEIRGDPIGFKSAAEAILGIPIHIGFGGLDLPDEGGMPDAIHILRDDLGRPKMSIAKRGNTFSFGWMGSDESFHVKHSSKFLMENLDLRDEIRDTSGIEKITLRNNGDNTASIEIINDDRIVKSVTMNAVELSKLIDELGVIRSQILPLFPNILPDGQKVFLNFDPGWVTRPSPHPSVPGPILAVRHPGFGWLGFILPENEALSLGDWLKNYVQRKTPDSQ